MARHVAVIVLALAARAHADPIVEQRLERVEDQAALNTFRSAPALRLVTTGARSFMSFHVESNSGVVDREDFYHLCGRDDLVDAYHERRRIGAWATLGGLAAGIGGLALYGEASSSSQLQAVGITVAVAGLVSTMVGQHFLVHPDPISYDETRALVDDYNLRAAQEDLRQWKLATGGTF